MSEEVRKMFADIAAKYDIMNDLLSFGIHRLWRKKAVRLSEAPMDAKILDCATGTGDFAFDFNEAIKGNKEIVGIDFCKPMVDIGIEKAKNRKIKVDFKIGDITNLPFEDNYFDVCSIGFGIRNVDNPRKGLMEMARVIKSGGKVVVLEFGWPEGFFSIFYNFYAKYLMPLIGIVVAGSGFAYTYLPETAKRFPCRDRFVNLMKSTYQFSSVEFHELSFGIAYIYIGKKK